MARRGHGEGSIYFDTKAGMWRASCELGRDANGKRRRAKVNGRTRAEVREKLRTLRTEVDAGLTPDQRTTVAELLRDWLANGLPGRSANTRDNYEWVIEQHLVPTLGAVKLRQLTPDQVSAVLQARADSGMSWSSVNRLRSVLQQALRYAERRGRVHRNVASLVETPDARRSQGRALTVAQAKALLVALDDDPLRPLVVTGLMCGLRPGELLGLQWVDLDTNAATLHVRRSLKRERAGLSLGPTKTARSVRALDLPPIVVEALKAQRAAQNAQRLLVGESWQDLDLIFCSTTGTPMDPSNLRRAFSRVTKAAGLGHWHPHELRHSTASLLSASGVPLEVVADVLGHDGSRTTSAVYRHAVLPTVAAAAAPMQRLFGPSTAI